MCWFVIPGLYTHMLCAICTRPVDIFRVLVLEAKCTAPRLYVDRERHLACDLVIACCCCLVHIGGFV
jgi:hypothetical protein